MGFTILEILVVIGLLSVISSFALIVGMDSYRSYSFRADRDTLVSLLQRARSQSVNNLCIGSGSCTGGRPHGLAIFPDSYVLFQGSSYALRDTAADERIPASTAILRTGLSEVVFAQLSGSAAPSGDITLKGGNGQISTTTISSVGQIVWTN